MNYIRLQELSIIGTSFVNVTVNIPLVDEIFFDQTLVEGSIFQKWWRIPFHFEQNFTQLHWIINKETEITTNCFAERNAKEWCENSKLLRYRNLCKMALWTTQWMHVNVYLLDTRLNGIHELMRNNLSNKQFLADERECNAGGSTHSVDCVPNIG